MKVNKCECSRDDKRVIESKADIARTLKEAGMPGGCTRDYIRRVCR